MKIMREIEEKHAHKFPAGCRLAYDGRKNVFTSHNPGWTNCTFELKTDERKYEVRFMFAAEVPMDRLKSFLAGEDSHLPHDAVNVLDVAMRTRPLRDYVLTGRAFCLPNLDGPSPIDKSLGSGCEAWRGYYQALKPIEAGLALSFDVSYSAFYIEQTLYDFAVDVLKVRGNYAMGEDAFPNGLDSTQIRILRNEIRGLKIEQVFVPAGQRKEKIIDNLSDKPATIVEFPDDQDNRTKTVAAYFKERYGCTLQHPQLPCIEVAAGKRSTYIPLELARIVAGQRRTKSMPGSMTARMIQIAARPPELRRSDIESMLKHANHGSDEYLKAFGVSVSSEPMKVKARILEPPKIQYRDLDVILSSDAQELNWSVGGRKLFRSTNKLKAWGVLVLAPRIKDSAVKNFVNCMKSVCDAAGLEVAEPRYKYGFNPSMYKDMTALYQDVCDDRDIAGVCQLIMVIKEDVSTADYNRIKMIGDTMIGIPTQCVIQGHVESPQEAYCQNVMLKINAKLGGVNARVRPEAFEDHVGDAPWMIVGADLSHAPAADSRDAASVTACIGTLDRTCSSQAGCFRLQDPKTETIKDIGAMVRHLLNQFHEKNGFFPLKLIVYRDGVSDGQFSTVLSEEVNDIKEECTKLGREAQIEGGYAPPLTYIILQKRHHTRFFPLADAEKDISGNCLAGTVIDSMVTNPENYDFFMIAHNGIQGTSRPVRYTVLFDENDMSPDDLHRMTYNMCFTYARCTRTVSVVPVVYYANLLAARGRAYLSARKMAEKEAQRTDPRAKRGESFGEVILSKISTAEPVVQDCLQRRPFFL
jgi:eukaryotic translation initiation factor 2C